MKTKNIFFGILVAGSRVFVSAPEDATFLSIGDALKDRFGEVRLSGFYFVDEGVFNDKIEDDKSHVIILG